MESKSIPACVDALLEAAAAHRFERKLLLCRRSGTGRELLRRLAAIGAGWIGFETVTPFRLALELAGGRLAAAGLRVADEFDELAILDAAIDDVLLESRSAKLRELAEGVGLRQAIGDSVRALRLAGIGPLELRRAALRDREKRDALAAVVDTYGALLESAKLADAADVLRTGEAALREDRPLPGRVYLLGGHNTRGLSGRLIARLIERGADVLPEEAVTGLDAPRGRLTGPASGSDNRLGYLHAPETAPADGGSDPDLFAGASVANELREVMRRVVGSGLHWDEVEIVAVDPLVYGAALDGLARRCGVPVTYAVGLPLERTRPGRALRGYLRWIQEDFPDRILRALLMSGDVGSSDAGGPPGSSLARRLRRLRIGRGRDRYLDSIERALRALDLPAPANDDRPSEELAQQRERERRELDGLAAILRPVLSATPPMPGRLERDALSVSVAELAGGALALLRFVPAEAAVDRVAYDALRHRLERLRGTARRETSLEAAIAVLVGRTGTRVPAPDADGAAPWSSAGGHLHLSDVAHGGFTGRRATFVVGLDAGRFPAGLTPDPLLGDEDRRAIRRSGGAELPTSAERAEESRYELAALLARLRGRVTLSYAAWDPIEARTAAPAAEMLQAFRLRSRNPAADYDALHAALAGIASAVPSAGMRLDLSDVWLGALADGGIYRSGVAVVREAFRPLDRGLRAHAARQSAEATPHRGFISPRVLLDPRRNPDAVVSASRLEWLGACPHRYFLRYVLGVRPPDDPELLAERWLSPLSRGSLLHSVYEAALRTARERGIDAADDAFATIAGEMLDGEIRQWRQLLPPPGRAVFELECSALKQDVVAFVHMVREHGAGWVALEHRFGRDGAPPVELTLPSGATLRIAGAIDRVDRGGDGLVVIDYKTGSAFDYDRRTGTYRGGRRLQHVLYGAVAEQVFGESVISAEYHFPTVRARNHVAPYGREDLADGLELLERLLDLTGAGLFHPTEQTDDCRFCDFAPVCRVQVTDTGSVTSPAAEWTRQAQDQVPELTVLRELRRR